VYITHSACAQTANATLQCYAFRERVPWKRHWRIVSMLLDCEHVRGPSQQPLSMRASRLDGRSAANCFTLRCPRRQSCVHVSLTSVTLVDGPRIKRHSAQRLGAVGSMSLNSISACPHVTEQLRAPRYMERAGGDPRFSPRPVATRRQPLQSAYASTLFEPHWYCLLTVARAPILSLILPF